MTIGITLGEGECNAVRLAYDEATKAGLPVVIDTMFIGSPNARAAPAIEAAVRLTQLPHIIAVIGHNNSAASLAAAPIYNQSKVVQMSPNSTAVRYSEAGPYSYRIVSPDDGQGRFLADQLLAHSRGRRVALMYVNDDYGRSLRAEFLRGIPAGAVEWVLDEPHIEGQMDVQQRVNALVDGHPEVIVWLGRGSELANLLPEIRRRLGNVIIYGGDAVGTIAIQSKDPAWTGVSFVDLVDLNGSAEVRALRVRYKQRFGREPTASEVLAFDAMNVVIAAVRSGARTGAQVQEFLDALGHTRSTFQGVAGPIKFDAKGDVARQYVMTVVPKS